MIKSSKQRKKLRFYAIVFFLIIQLFILFLVSQLTTSFVTADDFSSGKEVALSSSLQESIGALLDNLDLKALEEYLHSLEGISQDRVKDRLLATIQGAAFDYADFGNQLLQILFKNVVDILPAFACIAAIGLLSGFLTAIRSNTNAKTTADAVFFITFAATLIPLIAVVIECFQKSLAGVDAMREQMQIIYPIMLTLIAACGGTITVSVCKPAVAFYCNTIVSVITSIVYPITIVIVVFSIANHLSKDLKINKFIAFFKSINKWIIGVCVSVFGIFFTLQGITVSTYDGITKRAAKYAITNGIPIIGGFLSGGFDLAVAGSILIKNSLGSFSIFLLLSVLFEPVVLLICVGLLLRLTAAITQPFGDGKIADFLGETAENLQYCLAGLLFTAFLYFLSIVLLVTATEAMF